MRKVKIIERNLLGFSGTALLLKYKRKYYVVSKTMVQGTQEILVFNSNKHGTVISLNAVTGCNECSFNEAIELLKDVR